MTFVVVAPPLCSNLIVRYVRTAKRSRGIGGQLVGICVDATWAVRFYERHGFGLVSPEEKDRLLRRYWSVPERQIETSVVLADERWQTDATGSAPGV